MSSSLAALLLLRRSCLGIWRSSPLSGCLKIVLPHNNHHHRTTNRTTTTTTRFSSLPHPARRSFATTTTTSRNPSQSTAATTETINTTNSSKTTAAAAAANRAQRRALEHYQAQHKKKNSWWWSSSSSSSSKNSNSNTVHDRNVQLAWYMAAAVTGALGATYASVPLYKMFCQATGFGGTTQRVALEDYYHNEQQQQETSGGGDDSTTTQTKASKIWKNFKRQLFGNSTTATTTLPTFGSSSSSARVHTWTDEEAAARLASLRPIHDGRLITVRFDSTVGDVLPWTFVPVNLDIKVVPGETALSFFRVTNHSDKAITGVATYNVHPPKAGLYFQKIQCFCFEQQRLLPGETVDMPVFFFIDPDFVEDAQLKHVNNITLSYTFFQTDEEEDEEEEDDEEDEQSA